jgi:SAM-dependent methyltransferase
MSSSSSDSHIKVIDYDADGYDYRQFWNGRDYENWAERRVLDRLLDRMPEIDWLADLGGGFGRNVPLYHQHARHIILLDYSMTNLTNAGQTLLPNGPSDAIFLIRGNLYHLPFRDGAFNVGSTVRVLHHLSSIDDALNEMGRTVAEHWILDVPIKHHLLARARAALSGRGKSVNSREPQSIGTPNEPYYNFHLDAIRDTLHAQGWSEQLFASVANFRRWEHVVPGPARRIARPVVYSMESVTQRAGRGWWGPSQFLWLSHKEPVIPPTFPSAPSGLPAPWDTLAPRMCCPTCRGDLIWTADSASCQACNVSFLRKGMIWDFVVE